MNKLLKTGMTILAASLVLAGCSSSSSSTTEETKEPEKILIGISPDYPPYESVEDGKIVGFDPDMTEWLFNYMNENEGTDYTYEFKEMSFDTIVSAVQTDQVQLGISGFTYDEDREQAVSFTEPYNTSAQVIVVSNGSDVKGAEDLNGKKVGVQLGATAETAAESIEGANVQPNKDVKVLMEMLKTGQIDAVVLDLAVAKNYEANGDYAIVGENLLDEENFIIAGKDNKELLEKVNEAIKAFAESEEYTKLKEQWGV